MDTVSQQQQNGTNQVDQTAQNVPSASGDQSGSQNIPITSPEQTAPAVQSQQQTQPVVQGGLSGMPIQQSVQQQVTPAIQEVPVQTQPIMQDIPTSIDQSASVTNPPVSEVASQQIPSLPTTPAESVRRDTQQAQVTTEQQAITQEILPPPPPPPPKPPASSPVHEGDHTNFLPKPLLITLGVLVIFVIILLGFNLLKSILTNGSGNGKVTLTYWGIWESPSVMQPVIADFEKQNPNITIDYSKEDPNQYDDRLLVRTQAGNGPDIFRYNITWLPMLSQILLPLPDGTISKDDLQNNYYPFIQNDLVKHGALYGVPLGIDTLALCVNNTLFSQAKAQVPSNWNDFITVARALTQKDSSGKIQIAGAAIGTYDNITHAQDILSLLFFQNGVNINTMTPAQNASDALTFYTSFASDQNSVWDNTLNPSLLLFSQGKIAMNFCYSYDIFAIKAANPKLDFSVYPVPHLPGRNQTVTNYWVEGVSAKSEHQQAAFLFLKFLAQKDTLTKLYLEESKARAFGELYPRSDLAGTLKNNALLSVFIQQAPTAHSSFFAGDTYDTNGINAHMNQYLGNAVRSVLGSTSADTAVQTLTQGIAQVLNQYGQQ